jgi:hypothetical protein
MSVWRGLEYAHLFVTWQKRIQRHNMHGGLEKIRIYTVLIAKSMTHVQSVSLTSIPRLSASAEDSVSLSNASASSSSVSSKPSSTSGASPCSTLPRSTSSASTSAMTRLSVANDYDQKSHLDSPKQLYHLQRYFQSYPSQLFSSSSPPKPLPHTWFPTSDRPQ